MKAAPKLVPPDERRDILNVLMECASDALFIVDPTTFRFLKVNNAAASMLGYLEAELAAARIDRIFPDAQSVLHHSSLLSPEGLACNFVLMDREARPLDVEGASFRTEFHGRTAILLLVRQPNRLIQSPDIPLNPVASEDREDLVETTLEFPTIIGQSHLIHEVCRLVGLVAKTDTTVLIQGESGTGKELVAQAIHFHSRRNKGPLVKVNCAALTETLLESELFGHKKGSFTGAIQDRKGRFKLADGGTIILDEIGSMSQSGQAKLLRVLQEKEFEPVGDSVTTRVDVRVIAMTNADLLKAIDEGKFREDLYYRLNAFPIRLPPLRERKVDIPLLARHFLKDYTISLKRDIEGIDPEAISMLMDYSWPGNVRELENTIEYAVILEKEKTLQPASLPDKLRREDLQRNSLRERLALAERQMILEALSESNWVKNRAARLLGVDRRNLSYLLNKHAIH